MPLLEEARNQTYTLPVQLGRACSHQGEDSSRFAVPVAPRRLEHDDERGQTSQSTATQQPAPCGPVGGLALCVQSQLRSWEPFAKMTRSVSVFCNI